MEAIYLSYFIEESTPAYGGEKDCIQIERSRSIIAGDTSNSLKISLPNHIGTHIDFPYHFQESGKKSSDYLPSFWLFDKIGFLNCSIEEVPEQVENLPDDIELLILKTGFGAKRNSDEYWAFQPVIPASFAGVFRQKFPRLRVFGFDLISLTSKLDRAEGKRAHLDFLITNEILVLEDMKLDALETAPDKIIISPLQLIEADGAPCTVIAYTQ